MRVQLVEVVLVDRLGLGQPQDVEGNPAVGVAVEEVGLHPGCVLGVLDKVEPEVRVVPDPCLDKVPVPAKRNI